MVVCCVSTPSFELVIVLLVSIQNSFTTQTEDCTQTVVIPVTEISDRTFIPLFLYSESLLYREDLILEKVQI